MISFLCLITFVCVPLGVVAWHPYDLNKTVNADCDEFCASSTMYQKLTPNDIQKYKLWPNLVSDYDFAHGESMIGFLDGMEAIWKNQHPPDCKTANYMIS